MERARARKLNGEEVDVPEPIFELTPDGVRKSVGGTRPTIEETEFFLLQAVRGAVVYEPHLIWGGKILVPAKVEGIAEKRLKELDPFTYRSMDEMRRLLKAQIRLSKFHLNEQCPSLQVFIRNAMDFE